MSDYLGMKWCGSIAITGCKDEITRTSSFYLISQENGKQMVRSVETKVEAEVL